MLVKKPCEEGIGLMMTSHDLDTAVFVLQRLSPGWARARGRRN